jgi:hypothetical protein
MHLKNGRRVGNGAYAQKGTASRVMVASRSVGSTSPGNYEWLFVYLKTVLSSVWAGVVDAQTEVETGILDFVLT